MPDDRTLTGQSAREQAESALGQMWPIAPGQAVTASWFANGTRAVVYALFDIAAAIREASPPPVETG